MTDRDEVPATTSDRSLRERLSHAARIAVIARHRRDGDDALDRPAARRLTAARLHAGAML